MQYRLPTNRGGMLSQQGYGLPINLGNTPVLNPSPTVRPPQQQPALQQNGATGNRRMSSRIPNQQIDMGSEGNIRMGGAILGAASEGALPALAAGAQMYGNIMDYNRQGKMAEYEQQMLRANEEAERQRLALKMQQDAAKDKEDPEARGQVRTGIAKLQQAKSMLTGKDNLTGMNWSTLVSMTLGRAKGDKEAADRLFLKELRLDSIMQRVSQTKGAISNAEMKLFGSQAPSLFFDQESVWIDWIDRQIKMSEILLNRLSTGERVDENAPLSETMPSIDSSLTNSGSSGGTSFEVEPEIEDIVNQYTTKD